MLRIFANFDAASDKKSREDKLSLLVARDPLAGEVDWRPLVLGGSNFKTRALKQVSAERYCFVSTVKNQLLPFIMIGLGGLPLTFGVFCLINDISLTLGLGLLAFGAIFLGVGILFWRQSQEPVTFDLSEGRFWKGQDEDAYSLGSLDLSELHAIQLISEWVRQRHRNSNSGLSFNSYELNLIRVDGERFNVVDHGDLRAIRRDAAQLSSLLGVPVWDLIPDSAR